MLLMYYPLFYWVVFKLSLLQIQNLNSFYLNLAFHKGACWDPYAVPYILLHSFQLYLNIFEFVAVSILLTPKYIYPIHPN